MYTEQDYSLQDECLTYIKDIPNGCLCLCPCGERVEVNGKTTNCPTCQRVYKYPAWASW